MWPNRDGTISLVDASGAWELHDEAYLRRIRDIWAHMDRPAPPAPDLQKMMALDLRQNELSQQMGKLAQRQAELAQRSMKVPASEHGAFAKGQADLQNQQALLAQAMADVASERAAQNQVMAEFSRHMADAAMQAQEQVNAVLADARRHQKLDKVD